MGRRQPKIVHPTLGVLPSARRCSRLRQSQIVTPIATINSTSAAAVSPASANITPMLTAITGSNNKPHPHPPGFSTAVCRHRLPRHSNLNIFQHYNAIACWTGTILSAPVRCASCLRLEIERYLGAQPITIRQAKVAAKAKVGVGRHATPSQDNLPNALSRNRSP